MYTHITIKKIDITIKKIDTEGTVTPLLTCESVEACVNVVDALLTTSRLKATFCNAQLSYLSDLKILLTALQEPQLKPTIMREKH